MININKNLTARENKIILIKLTDFFIGKTIQIIYKNEKNSNACVINNKQAGFKMIRIIRDRQYCFELELDDGSRYKFFSKNNKFNDFNGKLWTFIGIDYDLKII